MKDVCFLLDDRGLENVDLSSPTLGNPGVGGTEYCFVALVHAINQQHNNKAVLLHHVSSNEYPRDIPQITTSPEPESIDKAVRSSGIDTVVIRALRYRRLVPLLERLKGITVVLWAHNYLPWSDLQAIGKDSRITHTVFVGREQWALSVDALSFSKCSYINNGCYLHPLPDIPRIEHSAVYLGSLIPAKGFLQLARLWKRVREAVPDGRLEVIGSGALYDHSVNLGPLGLASARYEKRVLQELGGKPDEYGIHFHGLLGLEKFPLLSRCSVGVPNPTGLTETCPLSVLEMASTGLPVVGVRRWGMVDTIVDGETGLLAGSSRDLLEKVRLLLWDKEWSSILGQNGRVFIASEFNYGRIANQWVDLFCRLQDRETKHINWPTHEGPALKGRYWWSCLTTLKSPRLRLFGMVRDSVLKFESWRLTR